MIFMEALLQSYLLWKQMMEKIWLDWNSQVLNWFSRTKLDEHLPF